MQRSKAYYITRAIARLLVMGIQAGLIITGIYWFILFAWSLS